MMIELHGMIENDSDIYSALTQCGKLEMIDKLEIEKSSYNDFTDETYYYKEYIYTYNYKPFKGMETLAQNIVNILWNYDIFN